MGVNAQTFTNQQFLNRGFEEWVNEDKSSVEPVNWHSFKTATGSYSSFLFQQIDPSNIVRPGTSGLYSAHIYPKIIICVTANGNLTNGRINAGSIIPKGSNNYNYTQRTDADYCTPIDCVPDSLSLWVCFRATSEDTRAIITSVIHGDDDFRCLSDGGYSSPSLLCARAIKTFTRTSACKSEDYIWKRVSVPFVKYPDICTDYKYIMVSLSTNMYAGAGNTDDELFVDDILLIYNPSLRIGPLNQNKFVFPVDGSALSLDIPFFLTGTMSSENINKDKNEVIAQLSDSNGSFESPIELGRVTTDESGVIRGVIPNYISKGKAYRIRVISTNYPMISDDNGIDITIR